MTTAKEALGFSEPRRRARFLDAALREQVHGMGGGNEVGVEPGGAKAQQPVGLFEIEAEGLVERPDPRPGVAAKGDQRPRERRRGKRRRRLPMSAGAAPALSLAELSTPQPPAWIEVALAKVGFPAAGERMLELQKLPETAPGNGDWQMPEEIWRRLPPGELWIRGVDEAGRESPPVPIGRHLEGAETVATAKTASA